MGIGIDYGRGIVNIDQKTGIRYGVISAHDVGPSWYESSEADYGDPTCGDCGNRALPFAEVDGNTDDWTRAEYECDDYACISCERIFGSESAYSDEPIGFDYTDDGYIAHQGSDGDIFVITSPFYTRAAFCSPCAPGACYLTDETPDGEKAYCLDHDWFEDGKAPYRVFRVADDSEVLPAEEV